MLLRSKSATPSLFSMTLTECAIFCRLVKHFFAAFAKLELSEAATRCRKCCISMIEHPLLQSRRCASACRGEENEGSPSHSIVKDMHEHTCLISDASWYIEFVKHVDSVHGTSIVTGKKALVLRRTPPPASFARNCSSVCIRSDQEMLCSRILLISNNAPYEYEVRLTLVERQR